MTTTTKKPARAKKGSSAKNQPGVKNSFVNNINARRSKGKSRSKQKSTISKEAYRALENNWSE